MSLRFNPELFRRAFQANAMVAENLREKASAEELASAEVQVVAVACGLDREEANQLMAECLRMGVQDTDADPQMIRRSKLPAMIAIGAAFGYLAARREAMLLGEEEIEYRVAEREEGQKFAIEYRSSFKENWSSMPFRLHSLEAAEAKLAELKPAPSSPPYPGELLDELAEAVAAMVYYDQPISTSRAARAQEALNAYAIEVGRESVPPVVARAIAELGAS